MNKPTATRSEINSARTIEQLTALQKKYNYSVGWLMRVVEARNKKVRGY